MNLKMEQFMLKNKKHKKKKFKFRGILAVNNYGIDIWSDDNFYYWRWISKSKSNYDCKPSLNFNCKRYKKTRF